MKRYNPSEIEPKWQSVWADQKTYEVQPDTSRQKIYVANMFPYPSGAGLHAGHALGYSITDAIARFHRQHGRNVLNPIGWDAFGLPAENYAIKTGTAPAVSTAQNIVNFKNQIKRLGASIDWSREISSTDPDYYRWTQWIFTKFFERGLAYQKESMQWWCPVDKTVLANEQVEGGKCWRCGTEVVKKSMKQWFFKITEYAEELLNDIDDLDWPQKIKTAQTNWIGKSVGAEIEYQVVGSDAIITVFSTRPDTLFGATFVVLAPEHELVKKLAVGDFKQFTEDYVAASLKKSEIERMSDTKDKTGVFTGSYAINPATGQKVPIWVADYVLAGYGTGAVMAVPAHDERDFAFATKFNLPIVSVVEKPEDDESTEIYHGEGILTNSGHFDGMRSEEAREEIVAWLEQEQTGRAKTTYKMRDWLISRQRYWGVPIPIAYDKNGVAHAIPEEQLPVILPEVEDYQPDGSGKGVLARNEAFRTVMINGEEMTRETDTMDTFACSSWYLFRYLDPHNTEQAWDPELANYWAPLDYYVGGDHAVAHLLYVRFWTHVFKDMGLLNFAEPVKKLVYHGYINAEDGTKMSKSKGNVIDPLEIIDQGYGADALRTYVLFMGPIEFDSAWETRGVAGVYRFLNRVWTLAQEYMDSDKSYAGNDDAVRRLQHKTTRKVTTDFHNLSFNTAISGLMEYTNELYKLKVDGFSDETWGEALGVLVRLVGPFAPHMASELWEQLGNSTLLEAAGWPEWDDALITEEIMTIIVQVNGKLRAKLELAKDTSEEDVKAQALSAENVVKFLDNKKPAKVIYIPGRLVNIVLGAN
jgi:leucyl-tRNA synthetase